MIEYLEIKNFRNHDYIKVDFLNKNTFIEGLNGSGKTSIVEAINYVSLLKSFKTNNDDHLVKEDKPCFKIVLKTNKDLFEVVYNKGVKVLHINKKNITKMSEFITRFKTVVFSPEDLNLVYGTPNERRTFIDVVMVQENKDYLEDLSTYKKVLKERNALLKQINENSDLTFLKIINKRLEVEANKIIEKRTEFIGKLNKAFKVRFKSLNKKDDVEVVYEPNTPLNRLELTLNDRFKRDLLEKTTTAGPHRDELLIKFNDNLAKDYASQGQVRLIVIALKLALVDVYKEKEEVVVLLDDVLSELDDVVIREMENLFNLKKQIIITGTKCNYQNIKIINLNNKENQNDEWKNW